MVAPRTRPFGDIADFYAAIWSAVRETVERWHLAIVIEVAMVVGWFAIRTVAGADGRTYFLWVIAAGVLALVAPRSGLVVFVATSVFFEPESFARAIAPREFVLIPLAIGVVVRVAMDRFRWRPGLAIYVAVLLAAGTALGVLHSFIRFQDDVAWHAARSWLGNMLAPIILLIAAAWVSREGSRRVLVVAIGVAVLAAFVCLVEYASPGSVSTGPLAWVGFWKDFGARLSGTIPSPNALSAQLIVPTAVVLAAVAFARSIPIRLLAAAASSVLVVAHYLTYSRSPLVGAYVFAVIVAWRIRRVLGIVVLAAGIAVAALFLPTYLQIRSQSALEGAVTPGSILVASDAFRFRAWSAASLMWLDAPVTGQGYLAYKELADSFSDPALGSPHNEWLRLFAEEGLAVGLLGLLFIAVTARSLARIPGSLGSGLLGGFAAYVVAATFNNPFLFINVSAVAFPMIGVGLALAAGLKMPIAPVSTEHAQGEPATALN